MLSLSWSKVEFESGYYFGFYLSNDNTFVNFSGTKFWCCCSIVNLRLMLSGPYVASYILMAGIALTLKSSNSIALEAFGFETFIELAKFGSCCASYSRIFVWAIDISSGSCLSEDSLLLSFWSWVRLDCFDAKFRCPFVVMLFCRDNAMIYLPSYLLTIRAGIILLTVSSSISVSLSSSCAPLTMACS